MLIGFSINEGLSGDDDVGEDGIKGGGGIFEVIDIADFEGDVVDMAFGSFAAGGGELLLGVEHVQIARGGHAQLGQSGGHAVFKNGFQLVPLTSGARANVGGHAGHAAGGLRDLLLGHGLGLALQREAFLHQGLEHLVAFFLGLDKSAQAGQPDLLGGVLDGARELGARLFLVVAEFLQFLDHTASVEGVEDAPQQPRWA